MDNWERFEKNRKRKTGGRLTPGSGNKRQKGDVHNDMFVEEDKTSMQLGTKGYYIDLEALWFSKITTYANKDLGGTKQPMVSVKIGPTTIYCFVQLDFWKECEGAVTEVVGHIDCTDKKQYRMHEANDYRNHIFSFDDTGDWICLTEEDQLFIMKIERLNSGVDQCQSTKQRIPKRQKTQKQLDWEVQQKQKARDYRKALRQKLKERKKSEQED